MIWGVMSPPKCQEVVVLICIDLSRLYFAVRALGVTVNYEALLDALESTGTGDVDIVGFTIADPGNLKQAKFIQRLEELGVEMKVYPVDSPPSFTPEIATVAAQYDGDDILIVSGDAHLMRVFQLLREDGKSPRLCFFSDKLDPSWTPRIFSGEVNFFDLSDPTVRRAITA